jgi:hypothetical protein
LSATNTSGGAAAAGAAPLTGNGRVCDGWCC